MLVDDPFTASCVYRMRSCVSLTGLLLKARITSPVAIPALFASLDGGIVQHSHLPVSPGVPAAETSSKSHNVSYFGAFPRHHFPAACRVESHRLGSPSADGNSGVRAIALSSGACTPKSLMSKFTKPSEMAGESGLDSIISAGRIDKSCVRIKGMGILRTQCL